jgi:hypothetical protein
MDHDEDEYHPELSSWTMYGDVEFEGRTISLLVMTDDAYIAVESSDAPPPRRSSSHRAWLEGHKIELVIIDANLIKINARQAAKEFFERERERAAVARARVRASSDVQLR